MKYFWVLILTLVSLEGVCNEPSKLAKQLMAKGHAHIADHDLDGAAKYWQLAMNEYEPYKAFYFVIGDYYENAGNIDKACEFYLKTIKHSPSHDQAAFELGLCNMYLKEWPQAIEYFNRSIAIKPNQPLAYYYIASCHGVLRQHKLAKENLLHAIALSPNITDGLTQNDVLYKYAPERAKKGNNRARSLVDGL